MTDFRTDLEVLINERVLPVNKGKIRFVFRHSDRLKGGIEQLGLDDRSYNALRRNKICTIEQITENWNNLANLKGIGKRGIKTIKNAYVAYYYNTLDCPEERNNFWIDTYEATMDMIEGEVAA